MGSHLFDEAAKKLQSFASKINTKKIGEPSFFAIISATKYGYKKEEGVYIIPLGLLKD